MKITKQRTDQAVIEELGRRIAGLRIEQNLTQDALAKEAGVSKRTVERVESGATINLLNFVSVCRALGLIERFNLLMPEPGHSPIAQVRQRGRVRKRAIGGRSAGPHPQQENWTWDETP